MLLHLTPESFNLLGESRGRNIMHTSFQGQQENTMCIDILKLRNKAWLRIHGCNKCNVVDCSTLFYLSCAEKTWFELLRVKWYRNDLKEPRFEKNIPSINVILKLMYHWINCLHLPNLVNASWLGRISQGLWASQKWWNILNE